MNNDPEFQAAQYCSGSLIRLNWVLTTAHCMVQRNRNSARLYQQIRITGGVVALSKTAGRQQVTFFLIYAL